MLKDFAGKGFQLAPMGTGSEDFGHLSHDIPGFYFAIGANPDGGPVAFNHAPNFIFNEKASLGACA